MASSTRQLNVYALPPDLLSSLSVRTIAELDEPAEAGPSKSTTVATKAATLPTAGAGGLRCQTCPHATFEAVEDQREHFKSDWHRYNAKARIEGKKVVSAEQWDELAEGTSRSV